MVIHSGLDKNAYVQSLVDGLIKCGHIVVCNLNDFWDSFEKYDLLYFQWPEAIFNWSRNQIDLERLSRHFDRIKESGVRTVVTCHNLHPHNNDVLTTDLYNLVYSKVDAFHHLGRYSFRIMSEKYPHRYHFIAPHHIAGNLWAHPLCTADAKRRLHIPENNIVVSSFGAFRNDDEVRLFIEMAKDINNRHLTFLVPRIPMGHFYNGRHIKRTIKYLLNVLQYKRMGIKYSGYLPDDELNVWLYASDVVFIQRKEILNSGNLPLAYSAGKVVVGPDLGNVGEILKETENYSFNPYDRASVRQSVLNAIEDERRDNHLGSRNLKYAQENWSASKVCRLIDRVLTRKLLIDYSL
ncbi:MAG: hypothetical protein IJ896_02245 [Fibrobacter sp.]|nr:hypothetical protein [Fibrobacter sp.]